MIYGMTLAGAIHTVLAISGIAVGMLQFVRPKRGPPHRARGYAFVYAMLIADGAAMLVFQFTGKFNILHVGAIVNLACIVAAVIPVLRTPRPPNWKNQHYYRMCWSYVGLLAAAATELVVRTSHLATREQAWTVTAAISTLVTAIGYVIINRYRPHSSSQPDASDSMIPQDAAPS
jgi:uncharacterized membrane protein